MIRDYWIKVSMNLFCSLAADSEYNMEKAFHSEISRNNTYFQFYHSFMKVEKFYVDARTTSNLLYEVSVKNIMSAFKCSVQQTHFVCHWYAVIYLDKVPLGRLRHRYMYFVELATSLLEQVFILCLWRLVKCNARTGCILTINRHVKVDIKAIFALVSKYGQQAVELADACARMQQQRLVARRGRRWRLRARGSCCVRQPRRTPLGRRHRWHVSSKTTHICMWIQKHRATIRIAKF